LKFTGYQYKSKIEKVMKFHAALFTTSKLFTCIGQKCANWCIPSF